MTREKAIERFETLLLHVDTDCVMGMETTEAIDMAINALSEQHWIPVTKRLPEPRIDVWCNSDLGQMVGYYDETIETWFGRDYLELLVNAWMPLPEPYREGEENV